MEERGARKSAQAEFVLTVVPPVGSGSTAPSGVVLLQHAGSPLLRYYLWKYRCHQQRYYRWKYRWGYRSDVFSHCLQRYLSGTPHVLPMEYHEFIRGMTAVVPVDSGGSTGAW